MSKILMITSRFEGLPTSLLESLACETPVVAPNVSGISEVVNSNKNDILFNDYNNYENKIGKILTLIDEDSKLKVFGKNGRELIENCYTWEFAANKIERVYKELINDKKKS